MRFKIKINYEMSRHKMEFELINNNLKVERSRTC